MVTTDRASLGRARQSMKGEGRGQSMPAERTVLQAERKERRPLAQWGLLEPARGPGHEEASQHQEGQGGQTHLQKQWRGYPKGCSKANLKLVWQGERNSLASLNQQPQPATRALNNGVSASPHHGPTGSTGPDRGLEGQLMVKSCSQECGSLCT